MESVKRKICIATGTRAEWGLLSGIAAELRRREDVELQIVATNMHLEEAYGYTLNEIIADGFEVDATVPMAVDGDSGADKAKAMSRCMAGMAEAFERLRPDLLVVLGDRYEMLAVASVALMMRIPIAHIAGGEISEGAIDDSIRHAITKLSYLHLTATEENRRRVIQMGEEPDRVINTGATGVYNLTNITPLPKDELERQIGIGLDRNSLLVTYHPATLDDGDTAENCAAMLSALEQSDASTIIITYPNNDSQGQIIIDLIEQFGRQHPDRVRVIPSLGKLRYLSALHYVGAVVGNSSSGIVEVPSMGIPTVDIGVRQQGRLASESVIHCGDSCEEIARAIDYALSAEGRRKAATAPNPYYKPDTLATIVSALAGAPLSSAKKFYNL